MRAGDWFGFEHNAFTSAAFVFNLCRCFYSSPLGGALRLRIDHDSASPLEKKTQLSRNMIESKRSVQMLFFLFLSRQMQLFFDSFVLCVFNICPCLKTFHNDGVTEAPSVVIVFV